MGSRFLPALCVLILGLALPFTAAAQVRLSERGRVSQTVSGTTITVDYARPGARGRDIFGGVVHWGEVWTPGANWGTTLEVDRAIKLNGHDVPPASIPYGWSRNRGSGPFTSTRTRSYTTHSDRSAMSSW